MANIISKHDQESNSLKEEMNELRSENVKMKDERQINVNTFKEAEFTIENTEQTVRQLEEKLSSMKTR